MTKSKMKFILSNVVCILVMLSVLINNYTLIGLIAFLVGSSFLFIGTMVEKEMHEYGVSALFSFYVFIITITLFGIWTPFVIEHKHLISFPKTGNDFNFIGMFVGFGLFILFAMIAGSDKTNFYLKRVFKYIGMACLFLGVYSIISKNLKNIYLFFIIALFFAVCDIYRFKTRDDDPEYKSTVKPDVSYWMGMLISAYILFVEIFSSGYLNEFTLQSNYKIDQLIKKEQLELLLSKSSLLVKFDNLFSFGNVLIFVLAMIVLAAVFIYADNSYSETIYHDSFLVLSLGGFCLIIRVFLSNCNILTFLIMIVSLIVYVFFMLSMRNKKNIEKGNYKSNLVHSLVKKNKYAPLAFSVGLSIFTLFSIKFVFDGFIVSWLTLILCIVFLLCIRKAFNGKWTKNSLYWQMILISIFAFCLSVAFKNQNIENSITLLVYTLIVTSIVIWILGLRNPIWTGSKKAYLVASIFDCVVLTGIGLFAVV